MPSACDIILWFEGIPEQPFFEKKQQKKNQPILFYFEVKFSVS